MKCHSTILTYLLSTENNMAEELFCICLHLRGSIFQTIYGNQAYIEGAIPSIATLRNKSMLPIL